MKNAQPIRKSVLSFDNQRTSPPPSFGGTNLDFPQPNTQFSRIPSGNNINIENDFDETNININRQTPPLIGGGSGHSRNASLDFVNIPDASYGQNNNNRGGSSMLGSLFGMFAKSSAPAPPTETKIPASTEPVIDEVPLLEGIIDD
jgi:hypothetical protein